MLLFHLFLIPALVHFAAQSAASPLPSPLFRTPLTPRDQQCTNAPSITAGNPAPRRSNPILPRNGVAIRWCAPDSRTYIILITIHAIPNSFNGIHNDVIATLHAAWEQSRQEISEWGDHLIPGGFYTLLGDGGLRLSALNVNNHQMTWGVFGAALLALMDFMRTNNWYGAVSFDIYDGFNNVATAFFA